MSLQFFLTASQNIYKSSNCKLQSGRPPMDTDDSEVSTSSAYSLNYLQTGHTPSAVEVSRTSALSSHILNSTEIMVIHVVLPLCVPMKSPTHQCRSYFIVQQSDDFNQPAVGVVFF